MLSFSSDQFAKIEREREERFIERMAARLRTDFPDQLAEFGVSPEWPETFSAEAVARARSYGVRFEEDFMLFLDAAMMLGPNFDTDPAHPDIAATLASDDLGGDEKMDFLDEYMIFGTDK